MSLARSEHAESATPHPPAWDQVCQERRLAGVEAERHSTALGDEIEKDLWRRRGLHSPLADLDGSPENRST